MSNEFKEYGNQGIAEAVPPFAPTEDSPTPPKDNSSMTVQGSTGPITINDMKQKLMLEVFSVKNWIVVIAALGALIDYLKANLTGGQFALGMLILTSIYIFARALIDSQGNGTTHIALRANGKFLANENR